MKRAAFYTTGVIWLAMVLLIADNQGRLGKPNSPYETIGTMNTSSWTVTIKRVRGQKQVIYFVESRRGETLPTKLSNQEFELKHPELYQTLSRLIASQGTAMPHTMQAGTFR